MSSDLIGKLVRWETKGQWFTARVTGPGSGRAGSLAGEVVDPGNYIGLSMFAPKQLLMAGDMVRNLLPNLITVVEEPDEEATRG